MGEEFERIWKEAALDQLMYHLGIDSTNEEHHTKHVPAGV